MLIPTAIATELAAQAVARRQGAAVPARPRRSIAFHIPNPFAALRARRAPCVGC